MPFSSTPMIPCEFCNEAVPMNRIYNHTMTCHNFRESAYSRYLNQSSVSSSFSSASTSSTVSTSSTTTNSNNNRVLLADIFAALCRNEQLDARDEDAHEEEAHERFDAYDEIDVHVDARHTLRRQSSRAFRLSTSRMLVSRPSATATAIIPSPRTRPHAQMQIVPYSPPLSTYERNLELADRLGRVVIGVKNTKTILRPLPNDDPTLCPICQDICAQQDAVMTHPCNHAFCEPCISRWFLQSKFCPVCKHEYS